MAVNFKIYQSNRKGETNGKYYARATYRETVSIKELAEVMQNNSTVKKSDIVAVLTELSEVIRQELQRGNKVRLTALVRLRWLYAQRVPPAPRSSALRI